YVDLALSVPEAARGISAVFKNHRRLKTGFWSRLQLGFCGPKLKTAKGSPSMPRQESPQDLARRMAAGSARRRASDGFRRDTFALPREAARAKARELFARYPKAAYMTEIESWRELPDGEIEFTMRRLPTAD